MRYPFIVTLILSFAIGFTMSAQDYKVEEVLELKTDLSARTSPRKDAKGNDCALLKVSVPSVKGMQFSEKVGDVKYHPGELEVYIPEGTAQIRYSLQDAGGESTIVFSDYGISIAGKSVYKIVLKPERAAAASTGSLSIKANKDGSVVLVDGKPVGQIPVTVPGLSAGEHTVSVPNTTGYTCPDQKVTIKSGELSSMNLSLVEKEFMGLGLPILDDYDGEGYMARYKTINKDGKVGLADLSGKVIVPCEYGYVYPDNAGDGFFAVGFDDTGDTFIDRLGLYRVGKGLVTKYYKNISYDCYVPNDYVAPWFRVDKIVDGNQRKTGYIDAQGREILPFIFDEGTRYAREDKSSIIIASYKDDKRNTVTGVYDPKGNVIAAPRTVEQCGFHDGVSVGRYTDRRPYRFFIMDTSGKEIILPEGLYVEGFTSVRFENGLLAVHNSDDKWGYINHSGDIVIPCQYDLANSFENGYAFVRKNGQGMYINKKGETIADDSIVSETFYEQFGPVSYLVVTDGKHYGLMDENGKIRIPVKYDEIRNGNYISATVVDGETSVFDSEANFLFSMPDHLTVDSRLSRDGVIVIRDSESGTVGFADEKGNFIGDVVFSLTPPPYDPDKFTGDVPDPDYEYYQMTNSIISEGMIMLVLGDRFGFMDKAGKTVVPAIYTAALPFENGVTFVRKQDGEWIKIDKMNKKL